MPCTFDVTDLSHPEVYGYASVTVPSRVESIRLATRFLVEVARNMHVPPASDSLFEVAIDEALSNALKYGNAGRRPEALIVCELELIDRRLSVRIFDQGPGFALPRTPPPEWRADNVAMIPEGGFGLPIIQSVFPMVRTIARPGEFGLEMALTF
jgi:anti-sigma regulatory factor (Ser/Thr protein kinase)